MSASFFGIETIPESATYNGTWITETFDGDGATTVFTLSGNPGSSSNADVVVDGLYLTAGKDYDIYETALVLVAAPPAGVANIGVKYGLAVLQTEFTGSNYITEYGGVSGVDCTTAINTASAAGVKELIFPAGYWIANSPPTIANSMMLRAENGARILGVNLLALGFVTEAANQTIHLNTANNDYASVYIRRQANHTGGTAGYVSSGLRVDSHVTQASANNYEWGIVGVMYNHSSSGQNVGGYFQGNAYGIGATWGGCVEATDMTYTDSTGKLGLIGLEVDNYCNGADVTGSRTALLVVCGDAQYNRTGVYGTPGVVKYGINVFPQSANTNFENGIVIWSATETAFQNNASGTYAFRHLGVADAGFDTSGGTVNQAAFKMAQGQSIAFNASATRQLIHNGGGFIFENPAVPYTYWALNDNLSLTANGVQLLGTRRTGWGAPTGVGTRTTFDTAAVTLPQLAERLKALIDDLTLHGLIGA